jgi:hypothetical protein
MQQMVRLFESDIPTAGVHRQCRNDKRKRPGAPRNVRLWENATPMDLPGFFVFQSL